MDSSGVWHSRDAGSAPILEGSLKAFEANRTKRKRPAVFRLAGPFSLNPAASYSSIRRPYSTIGAGGLNGRVRDGIGCDTSAIATGKRWAAEKPPAEPVLSRVEGLRLIRSLLARRSARASHLALFERPKNLTILSQLNTGTLQLRGVALVNMVKPHDQLV